MRHVDDRDHRQEQLRHPAVPGCRDRVLGQSRADGPVRDAGRRLGGDDRRWVLRHVAGPPRRDAPAARRATSRATYRRSNEIIATIGPLTNTGQRRRRPEPTLAPAPVAAVALTDRRDAGASATDRHRRRGSRRVAPWPCCATDLDDARSDVARRPDDRRPSEQRAAAAAAATESWIARNLFGFSILHYDDVVAMLRDKRWHSASGKILEMSGIENPEWLARRRTSILSAEGDEHTRLRRLVGPAFSPRHADALRPYMRERRRRVCSTRSPTRARPTSLSTSASRTRSRSSASCSALRRRTGSCSRIGRPTSSGSSTATSTRTCRPSSAPRTSSTQYVSELIEQRRVDADPTI